ncbi:hypothetical protein MXE28_09400, partial [Veillonella sp. KGMB01456]|uniref:hypothetical protein n=1 Tax=Veillonella sp. KGMB01456 TaxID=2934794 RepID=UPI001FF24BCC
TDPQFNWGFCHAYSAYKNKKALDFSSAFSKVSGGQNHNKNKHIYFLSGLLYLSTFNSYITLLNQYF